MLGDGLGGGEEPRPMPGHLWATSTAGTQAACHMLRAAGESSSPGVLQLRAEFHLQFSKQ